jgi:O-6-methylguanine DNA methyltransferase
MRRIVSIPTDEGDFTASFSERGLAAISFPGRGPRRDSPASSAPADERIRRWQQLTEDALRGVLSGAKPDALPPLDWQGATEFQQSIWRELLRIPPGQTKTYAEVAAAAGRPRAVRAAGGACGANPIPVLVPCHRVVASGGKLGGFSGGLDWKRRLLAREGTALWPVRAA